MGEMVFPESDFYLNNLSLHLQQPNVSLFSAEMWFEYSASIFTGFLTENLGGVQTLRRIWEACRTQTADVAIQKVCGDFREIFTAFWCYNYLRAYKDGTKYPVPEALEVKQLPFRLDSSQIAEPQYYGANLIKFSAIDAARPLQIVVSGRKGTVLGAKVIVIDAATKRWKITPVAASSDGTLRATASGAQQAVLVIANFPEGSASYTLSASQCAGAVLGAWGSGLGARGSG
ncbi:MAG: hypothetical protein HY814_07490, partial [Candidatus Riflebacteria bacterium]|nr:hypothetical protein [Candidatus Riflebacteria bacterium]